MEARDCERATLSGKYPLSCERTEDDLIGMWRDERVGEEGRDGVVVKSHDDARETREDAEGTRPGGQFASGRSRSELTKLLSSFYRRYVGCKISFFACYACRQVARTQQGFSQERFLLCIFQPLMFKQLSCSRPGVLVSECQPLLDGPV